MYVLNYPGPYYLGETTTFGGEVTTSAGATPEVTAATFEIFDGSGVSLYSKANTDDELTISGGILTCLVPLTVAGGFAAEIYYALWTWESGDLEPYELAAFELLSVP